MTKLKPANTPTEMRKAFKGWLVPGDAKITGTYKIEATADRTNKKSAWVTMVISDGDSEQFFYQPEEVLGLATACKKYLDAYEEAVKFCAKGK